MSASSDTNGRPARWLAATIGAVLLLTAWSTAAGAQAYPGGGATPPGGPSPEVLSGGVVRPGGGALPSSGALPFTGANILLLLLAAAVCITLGVVAWRSARAARLRADTAS